MEVTDVIDVNNLKAFVIDNTFNSIDYDKILHECIFLCNPGKLLPPLKTSSAVDSDGAPLKSNRALFLTNAYRDPEISDIVNISKKLASKELFESFSERDYLYKTYININEISTLLSYYEKEDFYRPHSDHATFTMLTWIYQEPKAFKGGDLILNYKDRIECKNNRSLIFPSFIRHEVTPVEMEEEKLNQKLGRFTISQFFHINPNHR